MLFRSPTSGPRICRARLALKHTPHLFPNVPVAFFDEERSGLSFYASVSRARAQNPRVRLEFLVRNRAPLEKVGHSLVEEKIEPPCLGPDKIDRACQEVARIALCSRQTRPNWVAAE